MFDSIFWAGSAGLVLFVPLVALAVLGIEDFGLVSAGAQRSLVNAAGSESELMRDFAASLEISSDADRIKPVCPAPTQEQDVQAEPERRTA